MASRDIQTNQSLLSTIVYEKCQLHAFMMNQKQWPQWTSFCEIGHKTFDLMNINLKGGKKENEIERVKRTKWLYKCFISILGKSLLNIHPMIKLNKCILWR